MKKLLIILFLIGFANAQLKRTVILDTFNLVYKFGSSDFVISQTCKVGY